MQAFGTLFRNNVNVNMNPDNWEGVIERRTSIGSEALYLLNLYWYLTLLLQRRSAKKIWTKQPPKNARRNFTSDLRPSPKNFVKVSNVPYINCLHYQKSECQNLPLSFLRLYSVVCFLIISLDSIKFAPQAVEEDQDIKRLNKEYHTNCANIRRSA